MAFTNVFARTGVRTLRVQVTIQFPIPAHVNVLVTHVSGEPVNAVARELVQSVVTLRAVLAWVARALIDVHRASEIR
jgi:hypothetical protein